MKWNNVAALALFILAVVLLIKYGSAIGLVLASVKSIGPGNTTEDKTLGLVTLGVLGACFVAVVRLLVSNNRK